MSNRRAIFLALFCISVTSQGSNKVLSDLVGNILRRDRAAIAGRAPLRQLTKYPSKELVAIADEHKLPLPDVALVYWALGKEQPLENIKALFYIRQHFMYQARQQARYGDVASPTLPTLFNCCLFQNELATCINRSSGPCLEECCYCYKLGIVEDIEEARYDIEALLRTTKE